MLFHRSLLLLCVLSLSLSASLVRSSPTVSYVISADVDGESTLDHSVNWSDYDLRDDRDNSKMDSYSHSSHSQSDETTSRSPQNFDILSFDVLPSEDEVGSMGGIYGLGESQWSNDQWQGDQGLGEMGSQFYSSSPSLSFDNSNKYNTFFGSSPSLSDSKKQRLPSLHLQGTPLTSASVELKPITSYVVREQPIKSPRTIIQPIIHQRLVEQPITKTRIITQPVIRRLITQPIIQPHVIQTTQIKQKIFDQPITVPRITRQDIIKQVLVEQHVNNKPITREAMVERRQPKLQTLFMGKAQPRALSRHEALLAAHPAFQGQQGVGAEYGYGQEENYNNNNKYQFQQGMEY